MTIPACKVCSVGKYKRGSGAPYQSSPIYWHVAEHTPDMDKKGNIAAFNAAFNIWQEVLSPIQLLPTSSLTRANIVVRFARNGDSDLPYRFEPSTLAYAFFPYNNKSDIWFNDAFNWGAMHSPENFNLVKVAVHEIGHSLNLDHSVVSGDIMEAVYTPNDDIIITADTLAGIEDLYGHLLPDEDSQEEIEEVFLQKMFPHIYDVYRLRHHSLVALATHLGVKASGRRKIIVTNVYDKIHSN